MMIAQTFWTRPETEKLKTSDPMEIARARFGFRNGRDHLMSWALSAYQISQLYPKSNVLITDKIGKAILVDWLQLPYASVSTALEDCPFFGSEYWAVGKIYSYGLHKEPFMNLDGDCYLWEKFSAAVERAPLVAQSKEGFRLFKDYKRGVNFIRGLRPSLPINANIQYGLNCGVVGGTDLELFREYIEMAMNFMRQHKDTLEKIMGIPQKRFLDGNITVEQFFLAMTAAKRGVKPLCLFREDWWNMKRSEKPTLTHLMGGTKCRHPVMLRVEKRVSEAMPRVVQELKPLSLAA